MPTYTAFVDKIQDWANKDETVLKDPVVQDCMKYAADNVYRRLRVTALEQTVTYSKTQLEAATTSANNRAASKTELTIPADLTEFIQLREIDDDGRTCRVFNEKTDLRTFNDIYAEKTQAAYWSRVGNVLIYSPGFNSGFTAFTPTKAELHYYKRLPALNALYNVTPANFTAGYLTPVADNAAGTFLYNTTNSVSVKYTSHAQAVAADTTKVTADTSAVINGLTIAVDNASGTIVAGMLVSGTGVTLDANGKPPVVDTNGLSQTSVTVTGASQSLGNNVQLTFSNTGLTKYVGNEVAHWLRDENEKLLLYGSLAECFYYLQDEDQAKKYNQLFIQELAQLNDEDNKRGASGGNVQINFNGRGMI